MLDMLGELVELELVRGPGSMGIVSSVRRNGSAKGGRKGGSSRGEHRGGKRLGVRRESLEVHHVVRLPLEVERRIVSDIPVAKERGRLGTELENSFWFPRSCTCSSTPIVGFHPAFPFPLRSPVDVDVKVEPNVRLVVLPANADASSS